MRLRKNDVHRQYVQLKIDGVAETLTGKTLYCKIDSKTRVACTSDPDQAANTGWGYFTFDATNGTGTTGTRTLTWSFTITATSEDKTIEHVDETLKYLEVWE